MAIYKYKDLTLFHQKQFQSKITFQKPVCVTGLVQRNKPVKFMFDLSVLFKYSITESILIWEYVILIRPKSYQLALPRIVDDFLGWIH